MLKNFLLIRSNKTLVKIICKGSIISLYLGKIETVEKIAILTRNIKIKKLNKWDFLFDKRIPTKDVKPNINTGK